MGHEQEATTQMTFDARIHWTTNEDKRRDKWRLYHKEKKENDLGLERRLHKQMWT